MSEHTAIRVWINYCTVYCHFHGYRGLIDYDTYVNLQHVSCTGDSKQWRCHCDRDDIKCFDKRLIPRHEHGSTRQCFVWMTDRQKITSTEFFATRFLSFSQTCTVARLRQWWLCFPMYGWHKWFHSKTEGAVLWWCYTRYGGNHLSCSRHTLPPRNPLLLP